MGEFDYVSNYKEIKEDMKVWYRDYFAETITKAKYLHPGEKDFLDVIKRLKLAVAIGIIKMKESEENIEDTSRRIKTIVQTNKRPIDKFIEYGCLTSDEVFFLDNMEELIKESYLLPAGRSLYGAMCEALFRATMSNCYIAASPEDSREGITKLAYQMFTLFSAGGGVGVNISTLRPRGAFVGNSAKTSSGAPSFIKVFDAYATTIGANNRRAALMICLDCMHPDIEEFIEMKANNTEVQGANLSVLLSNNFMEIVSNEDASEEISVEAKFDYSSKDKELQFKKTLYPKKLFNKFIKMNWNWAEPGAIFIDNVRENHLLSGYGEEYHIPTCNPCAEYFGTAGNACNLGSINLLNIVDHPFTSNARINFSKLEEMVKVGVRTLDAILDYGHDSQPLEENKEEIKKWRPIGLGVFGLADMFIALEIRYGSKNSLKIANSVMTYMMKFALEESIDLAKKYGSFKNFNYNKIMNGDYFRRLTNLISPQYFEKFEEHGLRNGSLISIAPTGSLSFMCNQSGGIEPHFSLVFDRTTHALQGKKTIKVVPKSVVYFLKKKNEDVKKFISNEQYRADVINRFPCLVSSSDISYKKRLAMQTALQCYVDNAISSTINVPQETTEEEIRDAYISAWKGGLKGITIFRDGCSRFSILMSKDSKRKEEKKEYVTPEITQIDNEDKKEFGKYDIRNYVSYISEDGKHITPLPNTVVPIKRKDVDDILPSITIVKHTSCVKNLYVTVTFLNEFPFELFVVTSDGCTSNIAGLSRSLSLILRSGGVIEEIIKEMKRCICNACSYKIRTEKESKCSLSCAIAVIDALEEAIEQRKEIFLKQKKDNIIKEIDFDKKINLPKETLNKSFNNSYEICPSCNQKTLLPGKCSKCFSCGYNSCNE